jgi:hypothetical protein
MLRDKLLADCYEFATTQHATVQALVDALMISLIVAAPNAEAAERDIRNICRCMEINMRQSYREYHDMAEAQRSTRQ